MTAVSVVVNVKLKAKNTSCHSPNSHKSENELTFIAHYKEALWRNLSRSFSLPLLVYCGMPWYCGGSRNVKIKILIILFGRRKPSSASTTATHCGGFWHRNWCLVMWQWHQWLCILIGLYFIRYKRISGFKYHNLKTSVAWHQKRCATVFKGHHEARFPVYYLVNVTKWVAYLCWVYIRNRISIL